MITLYTTTSCTSCRKARAWLLEHELPFVERNIFADPLNKEELLEILRLTKNGTEDIISTRSRIYQKLNMDFDELKLDELLALLEKHPDLLRRPIVMDKKRLQIGFNEDDIHQFIPRNVRKVLFREQRKKLISLNYINA